MRRTLRLVREALKTLGKSTTRIHRTSCGRSNEVAGSVLVDRERERDAETPKRTNLFVDDRAREREFDPGHVWS